MDRLTPDVVEWVVSDEKVASKWKEFAARLGLDAYVHNIDQNYSIRRKKFERQKLKELFDVWRRASPITYTRSKLMDVLGKEGLLDMYSFLQLLETQQTHERKESLGRMIAERNFNSASSVSSREGTPRSHKSLSPQPPFNTSTPVLRSAVSAPPNAGQGMNSPYSWYFNQPGVPHANGGLSSSSTGGGILKKSQGKKLSQDSSFSSDYALLSPSVVNGGSGVNGLSQIDSANSRESTPDSLSRQMSRVTIEIPIHINGGGGQASPSPGSTSSRPSSARTIRFADQVQVSPVNGHQTPVGRSSKVVRPVPGHQDKSVERYFDNLVSMIEDAAEGL